MNFSISKKAQISDCDFLVELGRIPAQQARTEIRKNFLAVASYFGYNTSMKIKFSEADKARNTSNTEDTSFGRVPMRLVKLSEMNPAKYNPRVMGKNAKKGLSNSIKEFGLVEPIIWNEQTGNIVGGHQRFAELVSKRVEQTDVVVVSLPLAKEKALNATLNNKFIQGDFVQDELDKMLHEINSKGLVMELQLDKMISEGMKDFFNEQGKHGEMESEETPKQKKDFRKSFASKFEVVIECQDEFEQAEIFEKMKEQGYKIRLLTL